MIKNLNPKLSHHGPLIQHLSMYSSAWYLLCFLNSADKIQCENLCKIMNIIPNCFQLKTLANDCFALKEMHTKTAKEKLLLLLSLWPGLVVFPVHFSINEMKKGNTKTVPSCLGVSHE